MQAAAKEKETEAEDEEGSGASDSLTAAKGCLLFGTGEDVEDEDMLTVSILPRNDKPASIGANLLKLKLTSSSSSASNSDTKQQWQFKLRTGGSFGDTNLSDSTNGGIKGVASRGTSSSGRELVLAAASEKEMMEWIEALKEFAIGESSDHVHLNQVVRESEKSKSKSKSK